MCYNYNIVVMYIIYMPVRLDKRTSFAMQVKHYLSMIIIFQDYLLAVLVN